MEHWQYTLPYIASLLISLGISLYAWRHRQAAGTTTFALYAFGQAWWTFGALIEMVSRDLNTKIFWDDFQWIGSIVVFTALFYFALEYTSHPYASNPRTRQRLIVFSALIALILYTDSYHHLVRTNIRLVDDQPFNGLYYDFTTFVMIISLYGYVLCLWGVGLLIRQFRKTQPIYRAQLATIIFGFVLFVIAVSLPVVGITELEFLGQRDISPLAFAIGNLVVAWGLFRYNLFDLLPVAREIVIENMPNAVITMDAQHRVVDVNPAAQKMLGTQNPIGQFVDRALPQYADFIWKNADQPHVQQEMSRADGYVELNLSSITNQQQEVVGRLLIIADVTERVKTRQEIEKLYGEQVKLVEELKALDAMKSQFLASMSHELRTPLNAILNFTEFMSMGMLGPVTEKQKDALEKTLGSGKHLLSLINDVLDMTKIHSGMMKLFVEDQIDLNKEINAAAAAMDSLLKDKSVQFVRDIDATLPPIVGDKRRIRQILLNLLSNAAKFTEEGSVTLAVKQRASEVLFMVSDTGPGIAQEDHDLIFEPFRQTEAGIQHAGGTGLGLPISRKLAEAHGGKLWVESTPGEGATFYVTLPVHSTALLDLIKMPEEAKHV